LISLYRNPHNLTDEFLNPKLSAGVSVCVPVAPQARREEAELAWR
jgi:hypothetical protein